MNYTAEQIKQIDSNIKKIVEYIEKNILPHIDYSYETGTFGPIETWGRCDEHTGRRYYIGLNGPYSDKIRFYHGIVCYTPEEIVANATDTAVNILKYWQDAKMYMNTEIENKTEIINLINSFEI